MSETDITRRDSQKTWDQLPVTERHVFNMQPFKGIVAPLEDVHFHFDSYVLLPDYGSDFPDHGQPVTERTTALAVIAASLKYVDQHPKQQSVLIAGHTDTVGAASYNMTLSQNRANNSYYVIMGKRADWIAQVLKKHKVEDYQQILKWINWLWEADCDPGDVDNQDGPKTQNAVKNFQIMYNNEFGGSPDYPDTLKVDGIVGEHTWGAFFDVYIEYLAIALDKDLPGLDAMRNEINYLTDPVGCGKNFPLEHPTQDNFKSATNRRVEILFFDPDQVPRMLCHPSPGQCVKTICEVYDSKMYHFTPLPVPPLEVTNPRRWVVQVMMMDEIKPRQAGDKINYVPLKNADYQVDSTGGADPVKGKTDGDGIFRIPVVNDPATTDGPPANMPVTLLPHFTLAGGTLISVSDPSSESGAENRLYNMGFGTTSVKDESASDHQDAYTNALHGFEDENSLPETEAPPDDSTRGTLQTQYGS